MSFFNLLFCLSGGCILIFIIETIKNRIRTSRFTAANGCRPPPSLPQRERILGLDLLRESAAAVKAKNSLELAVRRITSVGDTFLNSVAGMNVVTTIDPVNIHTVLTHKFDDYNLGGRIYAWGPLVGMGVFTSDGPEWAHRRAILRPNFNKQQIASLEMFERHIQHLLAHIPQNGSTFDLQKLFFSMTLDSATEFLFGHSVGAQGAGEGSEADKFQQAFDFAQHKIPDRNRLGKLNLFIPDRKFFAACKDVHDWADKYVELLLKTRKAEKRYVCLNEIADEISDPQQLRDEMLNVLLAGRDTTAGLLSNTFHVLARHPDVWNKLRAAVDELHGELPTYDDLKNMEYLKWVMNEVLRLYPPVPTNARFAKRDTVLPQGGGVTRSDPVYVAKGSIVIYSVYTLHRRKDIYGPTADDFVPERWAPDAPDGPLRPGFGFIPFSGGPRICVGQQYALTEAGYAIVRLCQTFRTLENRDPGPWREGLGLTLCSGDGTKVGLIK